MTISPTLMKAILAMDSYNRGYNAGIVFGNNPDDSEAINGVTKLGNYQDFDRCDMILRRARALAVERRQNWSSAVQLFVS